ncbi:TPA: helix-turn-helix transcriptional regulator [Pseudomonas aeruginosa]
MLSTGGSRVGEDVLFSLSHQTQVSDVEMPPHTHREGQLYVVAEGSMIVATAHETWLVAPGQIGWIPPEVTHSARVHGTMSGWVGHLAPELSLDLPGRPTAFRQSALSAAILERLPGSGVSSASDKRELRLLEALVDELGLLPPQPMCLPYPKTSRLAYIARKIIDDLAVANSLDDMAALAFMSRRSLTRQFRAETGMSIVEWRDAARMQRAVQLLAAGHSVTSIAYTLGYDGASRFIDKFSATFGVTPKQFSLRSIRNPLREDAD